MQQQMPVLEQFLSELYNFRPNYRLFNHMFGDSGDLPKGLMQSANQQNLKMRDQ